MNNKTSKQTNLFRFISKVPSGSMLIPMVIGALINTFFSSLFKIGDPTTAIFSENGTMTIVGTLLVLIGIQISPQDLLKALKRGGILIFLKLILNTIICILIIKYVGLNGVFGISTIALVACITSTNPGLYLALMKEYGDETDVTSFAFLNLVGLPFIPITIIGSAQGYGIDYKVVLATLIPMVVGFLLGLMEHGLKEKSQLGIGIMIPFLGFCLGTSIDIKSATLSIGLGVLLFLIYILVNNIPLLLFDKLLLKQKGHASMAICSVAGLSIIVPKLMIEVDQTYSIYMKTAMSQITFVVILSTFLTPLVVKKFFR